MKNPSARIVFSLQPGTLDTARMSPDLWIHDEEACSAHVPLDSVWDKLLPALESCGLVMACGAGGPVSTAVAIPRLRLSPVPDSADWVCLASGLELYPPRSAVSSPPWSRWTAGRKQPLSSSSTGRAKAA